MLDIKYGLHGHTTAFEFAVTISANAIASTMVAGVWVKPDDTGATTSDIGYVLAVGTDVVASTVAGLGLGIVWDGVEASASEDTVTIVKGKILAWTDKIDSFTHPVGTRLTLHATNGTLIACIAQDADPYIAVVLDNDTDKTLIETV